MPANDRPRVEQQQRAAEQRRGEKAVVAVADIDEHGREGERQQQPEPVMTATSLTAVMPARRMSGLARIVRIMRR